jgi:preprotein translocase subunit SecA
MRLFGSERIAGLIDRMGLDENTPIDAKILSNSIENAQRHIEDNNFKRRKYVLSYDDVMNQQRSIIYKQRGDVLDGGENIESTIKKMILSNVNAFIAADIPEQNISLSDLDSLRTDLAYICTENDLRYTSEELGKLTRSDIENAISQLATDRYIEKEKLFGKEVFLEVQRSILLRNVDTAWMEHIDAMDDLKGMINLQSYAHRDPVTEYRIAGGDMFDNMIEEIRDKTVRMILTVSPRPQNPIKRVQVANPLTAGFEGGTQKTVKKVSIKKDPAQKVGRNDPCPCGSGKKYKNCCGAAGVSGNQN